MFIHGGPLSAHSARPPKIPGWIVDLENFSVNKRVSFSCWSIARLLNYGIPSRALFSALSFSRWSVMHPSLSAFCCASRYFMDCLQGDGNSLSLNRLSTGSWPIASWSAESLTVWIVFQGFGIPPVQSWLVTDPLRRTSRHSVMSCGFSYLQIGPLLLYCRVTCWLLLCLITLRVFKLLKC